MIRCRVLTDRIINGRKCRQGDTISLKGPIVDFLIEHCVIEKLAPASSKAPPAGREDVAAV